MEFLSGQAWSGRRGISESSVAPDAGGAVDRGRMSHCEVTRGRSVALRRLFGRPHGVRTRLGDITTERRGEPVSVVSVDLGLVPATREGHIRQPLIHQPLTGLLAVDVQQDTIRRQPLTAVARDGVPVIEVAVRAWTVRLRIDAELEVLA